jgi:hypothetical protein
MHDSIEHPSLPGILKFGEMKYFLRENWDDQRVEGPSMIWTLAMEVECSKTWTGNRTHS